MSNINTDSNGNNAKSQFTNLYDELMQLGLPNCDHLIVERHGDNIISSSINFFDFINERFSEDDARKIESKLMLALKNRDRGQFGRAIRRLKEDDQNANAI